MTLMGVIRKGKPASLTELAEMTASIGVAERLRDGVEDWPQLVELADQRMYKSKTAGKARCTFGDGDVMLPE
ncbi:MAG: hypothetical protein OEL53_02695 [Rhodospirillales bacterium]|nr:hypothetical protein [Rhodospirillales bacterium]